MTFSSNSSNNSSKHKKQGAAMSAVIGALALGGVAVSAPVAAAAGVTITAKTDNTKPTVDTVFTISGEMKGAKPGAKVRLQWQKALSNTNDKPAWSTLPYTTFTDKSNKFAFLVKLENLGAYNLRVLHPKDDEGPQAAYSDPFRVKVSG